ncbi:reverse transcriptase domain-containing protein [Tanacetum coccineum]
MTRQKVTQSFERVSEITFPSLTTSIGTEGPLIIEAEIGGHMIHRMYVDGGSSTEVIYENCFNRLRLEIKNQMVPATTSLTGFSGETIWPLGQLRLLVKIGDAVHSTKAWMNFMIVRSLSPYNGIIGRPRITEHRLNIREGYSPVRQKKRGQAPERALAIQTEVQKLVEAGIMREVYYHEWLSNSVMVKKHDGSWWMCVDFTDLNKACLQDCYPLPEIGWKVESLCVTPLSVFWMLTKPITRYRWQSQMKRKRLSTPAMGYIDIPKCLSASRTLAPRTSEAKMLRDIDETFRTLRKFNMKLNPKKCTFGPVEGMFLGYMISLEGIKPCPDKTDAVLQLPSPRTIKEVQSLNGKLASLNRFLSKSAEKSFPLFKTLKKCIKKSDFHWIPDAEQAFKQLKQHLSELPLLVAPKPKEELIVYMSASHGAISAVLKTERGMVQTLVYFESRSLQDLELNYTPMEKLVLSLVFVAKRLRRYFQAHHIAILADFLVEKPNDSPPDTSVVETPQEPWTLFMDRSSCVDGSNAGLILTSPKGTEFTYALRFQFTSSNNEAEYEALLAGLRITTQMGVRNVHVSVDSKLVANQVLGAYVAKEENMIKYLEKVKSLVSGFANFSISQVPQSKNKKVDALSKIASTSFAHLSKQVLVEILKEKSIQEKEMTTVVEEDGLTWMTPIIEYLKEGTLPDDKKEASKLRIKAKQYGLWEGVLYRRSFLKPWIRCIGPLQADYVIREIHDGSCRKVKFLIVAMDYFTKWIEAKAVSTITGNQVKKFVWDNIVCGFGLPREIVSDNDKQFSDNPFKDWCEKLNIAQRFASVKHPQSNGLVERANRSLGDGIKARLGKGNKIWIEELPHVL